ncbi:MAG: glycosyltransferase [Acidimicrobiia bacterium]|nr:glycosyltransferase [Acidimicrobiia bacterium]
MRGVFVVPGSLGHLHPQAALAQAMLVRGHEVTLVTTDDRVAAAQALGFDVVSVGPPAGSEFPGPITFLVDDDAIGELERVVGDRGADFIVHDHVGASAALVGRDAGIPAIYVGVGTVRPPEMVSRVDSAVRAHCSRTGRIPLPDGGLYSTLHLSRCPPSLQPSGFSALPNTVSVQPFSHDGVPGRARSPGWLDAYRAPTTVYVTLGSWGAQPDALELLAPMVSALARLDAEVIVTVGSGGPISELQSLVPGVRVEGYVPQKFVMDVADLVVCHGGSGAILGALSAATPVVAAPQGADHFWNCELLVARGAGLALGGGGIPDPEELTRVVDSALASDGLRASAAELAQEIAQLPDLAMATDLILATATS